MKSVRALHLASCYGILFAHTHKHAYTLIVALITANVTLTKFKVVRMRNGSWATKNAQLPIMAGTKLVQKCERIWWCYAKAATKH